MASANEAFTAPTEGYEPIAAASAWGGYQPTAQWSDTSTILAPGAYRNSNLGYVPHVGDVFWFKSVHHAIYDNFPEGRVMRATDSFVDLTNTIIVEQSLVAGIVVGHKKGRKSRHTFVAVQFINIDQTPLWANYSKDGGASWLRKDFELTTAEKLRREGVVSRAPMTAPLSTAISQQMAILDGAASTASPSAVSPQELDETHEQDYQWVD